MKTHAIKIGKVKIHANRRARKVKIHAMPICVEIHFTDPDPWQKPGITWLKLLGQKVFENRNNYLLTSNEAIWEFFTLRAVDFAKA